MSSVEYIRSAPSIASRGSYWLRRLSASFEATVRLLVVSVVRMPAGKIRTMAVMPTKKSPIATRISTRPMACSERVE